MCALVLIQINQLGSFAHAANSGFLDSLAFADERDDATVMVGIHLPIQQIDSIHLHGLNNGIYFAFVAAFRKIGNAFNQCGHNWQE